MTRRSALTLILLTKLWFVDSVQCCRALHSAEIADLRPPEAQYHPDEMILRNLQHIPYIRHQLQHVFMIFTKPFWKPMTSLSQAFAKPIVNFTSSRISVKFFRKLLLIPSASISKKITKIEQKTAGLE